MSGSPQEHQSPFDITEPPMPVADGPEADGRNFLEAVEADFRNLMRRLGEAGFANEELQRRHRDGTRDLLLGICEVLDAFERVFRNIEAKRDQVTRQMEKWINNFRTLQRMLQRLLAEQGVVAIENLEQGFDPRWHKVADILVDLSRQEGTIVEEARRGYMWHSMVLRKAEVVVVRHRDEPVHEERG